MTGVELAASLAVIPFVFFVTWMAIIELWP